MERICTIPGCGKPKRSANYCAMHWNRLKRHGDTMPDAPSCKMRMGNTTEYSIWEAMRRRCNNKNSHSYYRYGGRGITVCERWNHFSLFLQDMGKRPSKNHSLDRIDNNKGYSPENCRWATKVVQQNNTRRNRFVYIDQQLMTIGQAARFLHIPYNSAYWKFVGRDIYFARKGHD